MAYLSKILTILHHSKESTKDYLVNAVTDVYAKIYISVLLAINGGIWVFAFLIKTKITEKQIALHYNIDFGIDYYGDINKVFVIPILGLIIALVNFILYSTVSYSKDRVFIAHLLNASAVVSNIILLTAIILIYLINY